MLDAACTFGAAQTEQAALKNRHDRERLKLLAQELGADRGRRDPIRARFIRPEREARDAHARAAEARSEAEGLRALTPAEAAAQIETKRVKAERAQQFAAEAVEHLKWRDATGILPAAQTLLAAADTDLTEHHDTTTAPDLYMIPEGAASNPKVVMLPNWAQARDARREGNVSEAARTLVKTAQWLLAAQHSYFAGMCAHYAIRTGHHQDEALAVLHAAFTSGGRWTSVASRTSCGSERRIRLDRA